MNNGCVAALEGVTKKFGKILALDGLDLEVRKGELFAVLGPNGAGSRRLSPFCWDCGSRMPDR